MKNPFRAMAKARRLARAGRPLSAALALGSLMPSPITKRAKTIVRKPRPSRPAPGTFIQGRFSSAHGERSYKLYTPHGSTRRRLPLVVMLHGCGQSADDFARGTGMNALADELGFLVLYPEQSMSANVARCWNWHRPSNQKRGAGEPALLAALTREVVKISKANPSRIYVAGLSAGAAAAAILASAYPDLFVALGIHSGPEHGGVRTLTGALSTMRNGGGDTGKAKTGPLPPTIVFHGDQDTIVHPSNAAGFLSRLRHSRANPLLSRVVQGRADGGREFTRTMHRYAAGPVLLEDWVVHGSGHAWSGGNGAGSHTDPAGPDASREMMRFFLARKRTPASRPKSARSAL